MMAEQKMIEVMVRSAVGGGLVGGCGWFQNKSCNDLLSLDSLKFI